MKRTLAIILVLSIMMVSVPVMANGGYGEDGKDVSKADFSDISRHWAKSAIEKMASLGIVKGFGNGLFLPDAQMRRSEFVVSLHKASQITINYFKAPDISEFYNDVKNEDWYASALYDLASLNIVDDRGKFRPNDLITREEMVHYLINTYKYKLNIISDEFDGEDNYFDDEASIQKQYKKSVKYAFKLGFVKGRGNGKFDPKGSTTRAEAMIVLDKLMEALKEAVDEMVEQPKDAVEITPSLIKHKDGYKMMLTIRNNSEQEVVIEHSSGQKYDFVLLDDKKEEIYRWSEGRGFTMALTQTTIPSGKIVEFSEEIDGKTYGEISDKVYYFIAQIVGNSEDFEINKEGYSLKLKEEKDDKLVIVPSYEKGKKAFAMKLAIKNTSNKPITINHTSGQKFDFKLLDENKEIIYTWSADKMFIFAQTETVIDAGKTVEFTEELDVESFEDVIKKAVYLKAYVVGTCEDCDIEKDGYEIEIK
ncbi:BsuPI-related putative proteinase inhibitor [Acetivibrio mesophilus]|uniref:S-layer protein n=1 Tax=Acetivibrio mesophilus TaxID=2487273 RepID=A0A4Q0I1H8_9FIRM|nr:BsuPI-related putative proteinase inhibitor [Acetivibrio mesophilus]RXE58120.1 S-layer protein [Acetivibrio mesophilus]